MAIEKKQCTGPKVEIKCKKRHTKLPVKGASSLGIFGVAGTDIEEGGLLLGVTTEFGHFIAALGCTFLFSLAFAFSLIALFLLARLFFLAFVER